MTRKTVGVMLVCGLAAVAGGGIWAFRGAPNPTNRPAEPVRVAAQPPPPIQSPAAPPAPRRSEPAPPPAEPLPVASPQTTPDQPPIDEEAREAARRESWDRMRAEAIQRFDADGDGELNDEERAAARAQWESRGSELRQLMVHRYDADGDGELNEEERDAARQEMREVRREIRDRIVPEYDLDGDGELNEDERDAARPAFEAEYDRLRVTAMLDRDASRIVEPGELATALISISGGDPLFDLNRDGEVDYRDATYATEIAQGN